MQPKSHEELIRSLKNTLLNLDRLIEAGPYLTHIDGVDMEKADLLLKAYYSN